MRHRLGARFTQRVGLSFAAAFCHGFRKVGKQHGEPEPKRDLQIEVEIRRPRRSRMVVITLPISTTNMTGFPIILRGFSFVKASTRALRTIFHSR